MTLKIPERNAAEKREILDVDVVGKEARQPPPLLS
jgi:hypothetical protein